MSPAKLERPRLAVTNVGLYAEVVTNSFAGMTATNEFVTGGSPLIAP